MNNKPYLWWRSRRVDKIGKDKLCKLLKAELKKITKDLKPSGNPPYTYDETTFLVKDKSGKVVAIVGPEFMKAITESMKRKKT